MDTPRIHVLHVEDDDAWAGLVDIWLASRGFKVRRLDSLAGLRSYFAGCTKLPLCVLLDFHLQDGEASSACAEMKRSASLQHIPVIFLTGQMIPAAELLQLGALYRVLKGPESEEELTAVVTSVLRQNERAQGVLDVDDLRLDPRDYSVLQQGNRPIILEAGHFAAFRLLVHSSPRPVALEDLYTAFLRRRAYNKEDPELAIRHTARNYVSKLRGALGPLSARIRAVRGEGYVYEPSR